MTGPRGAKSHMKRQFECETMRGHLCRLFTCPNEGEIAIATGELALPKPATYLTGATMRAHGDLRPKTAGGLPLYGASFPLCPFIGLPCEIIQGHPECFGQGDDGIHARIVRKSAFNMRDGLQGNAREILQLLKGKTGFAT